MGVHTKIIQIKINRKTQPLNATVKKKSLGISVKKKSFKISVPVIFASELKVHISSNRNW